MKELFNYPLTVYIAAGIACIAIMIIVDYHLGSEAEHLNAWVIVNRLFGFELGIPDSLAIRKFGLFGATLIMLGVNTAFGLVLINLLKYSIRLFHS